VPDVSFDRIADRYDATRGGEARGRAYAADLHAWLPAQCLEVGVGTGVIALGLRALGHEVVGVDISQHMLLRAHERVGDVVARVDGRRLPFADGTVDGALCVWVLQLVADRISFLDEIARVLRGGARFATVLGTPVAHDEIEAILRPMQDVLRNDAPVVADVLSHDAFEVEHDGLTAPQPFEQSPSETADHVEARMWSSLWDVDDATWQTIVEPTIAALRAMDDPDRPRVRDPRNQIVVLRRRVRC
jgi:ubiquinone/menaquinone biosynthesis C-methylase UbiE